MYTNIDSSCRDYKWVLSGKTGNSSFLNGRVSDPQKIFKERQSASLVLWYDRTQLEQKLFFFNI